MASILMRGDSQFQVRWRPGRTGSGHSCTFATELLALEAKRIAEAHHHQITRPQMYEALLAVHGGAAETYAPGPGEGPPWSPGPAVGIVPNPDVPTVAEWCDRFIEKKRKRVQPHVLKSYRGALDRHVKPAFGQLRLDEVTRETHIIDWVDALEAHLKPRTVHRYHAVLHQMFGTAVGRYIAVNPCDPGPGDPDSGLAKIEKYDAVFLTTDEANLLVAACPPQILDMVRVALGTGMRWGELVALHKQDVNLRSTDPKIHVRRARKGDGVVNQPKTTASRRAIAVPPSIAPTLQRILAVRDLPTDLVFPAPDGGLWDPTEFRRHLWLPTVARAQRCPHHPPAARTTRRGDLVEDPLAVSACACPTRLHRPLRFHDLRHTHVGNLIEAKWDLFAIQIRIGHESFNTTYAIYGHLRATGHTEELTALDKLLPGEPAATPIAATAGKPAVPQRSRRRRTRRRR